MSSLKILFEIFCLIFDIVTLWEINFRYYYLSILLLSILLLFDTITFDIVTFYLNTIRYCYIRYNYLSIQLPFDIITSKTGLRIHYYSWNISSILLLFYTFDIITFRYNYTLPLKQLIFIPYHQWILTTKLCISIR